MHDTNYISSIVKILELPKRTFLENDILLTQFRAQFPQIYADKIVNLTIWGNLFDNIFQYYTLNDYIFIEGHITLRKKVKLKNLILEEVEISILNVQPFF